MPEVVSRKCPNCSGELPPLGGADRVTCQYCGFAFDVKRTTVQPATPPPVASPPPSTARPLSPQPMRPHFPVGVPAAPRRSSGAIGCIAILAPLVIMGISGAVFFMTSSGGSGVLSSVMEGSYTFDKTIGFFQANADGVEDVAMIVRNVTSSDELQVVMFDGATGHDLWKVGELGSYSQGYQYTHAAVAGSRMLLTDFRGQARLLDVTTGLPAAVLALPDRAKEICAGPTPTQVRLTLQNGNPLVVDLAAGTAAPPAVIDLGAGDACPPPADLSVPQPAADAEAITIAGLEDAHGLAQGDLRVAVGRRASGVRIPMAVGLGPDGQTPTWNAIVPTVAETMVAETGSDTLRFGMGGGRLYVAYALAGSNGAHITAFDARSGTRLWDTAYSGWASSVDVDAMRVGPNRIVTEQFGEAEIFDAQTGALLRRVAPR